MLFSHKAEIFIYMTDCVADPVIVTVTINPCAHSHSYISSHLSLFYLKYAEQKRKEISPKGGGPPTKSIKSSIKISSLLYEDINLLLHCSALQSTLTV